MDQELVNLCNSIYNKYRRALDLIFENRDDIISQISINCKSILTGFPEISLDDSSKSKMYIKFRTIGLNALFKDVPPQYYYYQFEIKEDHITIMLEYHKDKYEELSDDVYNTMTQVMGRFVKSKPKKGPKDEWVWYRVWTEKTDRIDDENWVRDKIRKIMKLDGSEISLQQEKSL